RRKGRHGQPEPGCVLLAPRLLAASLVDPDTAAQDDLAFVDGDPDKPVGTQGRGDDLPRSMTERADGLRRDCGYRMAAGSAPDHPPAVLRDGEQPPTVGSEPEPRDGPSGVQAHRE